MEFGCMQAACGYGARIFILKRDFDKADPILRPLSCWRGADKELIHSWGYEFGAIEFGMAEDALLAAGFKRTDIDKFMDHATPYNPKRGRSIR